MLLSNFVSTLPQTYLWNESPLFQQREEVSLKLCQEIQKKNSFALFPCVLVPPAALPAVIGFCCRTVSKEVLFKYMRH